LVNSDFSSDRSSIDVVIRYDRSSIAVVIRYDRSSIAVVIIYDRSSIAIVIRYDRSSIMDLKLLFYKFIASTYNGLLSSSSYKVVSIVRKLTEI